MINGDGINVNISCLFRWTRGPSLSVWSKDQWSLVVVLHSSSEPGASRNKNNNNNNISIYNAHTVSRAKS